MVGCKNSTVAKINDIKISKDYYSKIESFLYTTGYIEDKNSKTNSDILFFIIDNEVAYQDALKQNIKVSDKEIDEKYEILKELLSNNSTYKNKLDEAGVDDEFLKAQIKKDLVVEKYKEEFTKDIKIKDSEIKSYYENHK